jgi:osmotically-inducible protein OsmY
MLALAAGVAGVKGVKDEIEIAAPETIPGPDNSELAAAPQPPATPPLPPQAAPQHTVDKTALERELNARLRANGVSGVTGHVNPDMSVALSGTVRNADERYRALTIGGSLPGANGVRETIQIAAPQVVKLAPPQAPIQAPPPQAAPPAPPPPSQAAAVDPAKLEGDINRALRSRDINSVTAQVNDDMSLTLKGSASASEKERALQLARQVRGIRGVKDKIFVVE